MMCGIAGSFGYGGGTVDQQELFVLRDSMSARGPDSVGHWISGDGCVGMAHRRLSILDLSEAGSQPMTRSGRTIVFNGEIYNFRDLKAGLVSRGYIFQSNSDTEVLLAMWEEHGVRMLGMIEGMFSFALWDSKLGCLTLARDPLGIKPLYWADDGGTLRFCSQVRSLSLAKVDTQIESAGLAGFLLWGSVPDPLTIYRGIHALPAGHYLQVFQTGPRAVTQYMSLTSLLEARAEPQIARDEAIHEISRSIEMSVRAHLESDVPIGLFLSAGLDSTMISAISSRAGYRLNTVTLVFDGGRGDLGDEAVIAESIANRFSRSHRTHSVCREDFFVNSAAILNDMDQPSIDGINSWFISREASKLGLKVALSGLGADELFASYPSFSQIPRLVSRLGPVGRLPYLGKSVRWALAPLIGRFASPKYAGIIEYARSEETAYMLRRGLFMPWELPKLMGAEVARDALERLNISGVFKVDVPKTESSRLRISAMELSQYMRNQLLRDADWAGMAHSLEIRTPFVDWKLISKIIPLIAAFPDIKKSEIARAVCGDLPLSFYQRPKTGFSVPLHDWMSVGSGRVGQGVRNWALHVYQQFSGQLNH